jgi:transcriptional regulator with GAF, ATPase, and Fis domain
MMSPAPTVPGSSCQPAAHVRQRDRRTGLDGLLASLTPALRRSGAQLRPIFEEVTRRLVSAEHLRLIDAPAGFAPIGAATGMRVITVPVPADGPAGGMMLEAVSAPGRSFEPWELQVLHGAGLVAALLLEIERARQSVRAPGPSAGPTAAHPRAAMPARWPDGAAPLIGATPAMRVLRHKIERVAATDFTLLIEGESGTGKELVARQVHELSHRRAGPFVAINCAALVETLLEAELFGIEERTATGVRGRRGKFEHADGGTLFLDEVADLSASAQAKLLRAIQDLAVERVGGNGSHRVDLRIIAATNRSLGGMVASGLFRSDLYFRLGGVEICVPPLRERQADIVELAEYFLERHRETRRLELSASVKDALRSYEWPGNVRELQRVVENILALASQDRVELDDLPPSLRGDYEAVLLPSLTRDDTMRAWGSRYARLVLQRCGDNKRRACDVLGISYHTLQAYLEYREQPGSPERVPVAAWPAGGEPDNPDDRVAVES